MYRFMNTLKIGGVVGLGLIISLCLTACGRNEPKYSIEVKNNLPVPAIVSLDGAQEKEIEAGGKLRFSDVEEGDHILRAEAAGFKPIEETILVDRDIIWTVEEDKQ